MKIIVGVVDGKRRQIVLRRRKCRVCKEYFQPKTQRSYYCSEKCRRKAEGKRLSEQTKARAKKWRENNPERARAIRLAYKDRIRHGGKKAKLIKEQGLVCSQCGKTGTTREIQAHHFNGSKNHSDQVLLCWHCHGKAHAKSIHPTS